MAVITLFNVYVYVGMCVHMCVCVHAHAPRYSQRPGKNIQPPAAGVRGVCELSHVGAGN